MVPVAALGVRVSDHCRLAVGVGADYVLVAHLKLGHMAQLFYLSQGNELFTAAILGLHTLFLEKHQEKLLKGVFIKL